MLQEATAALIEAELGPGEDVIAAMLELAPAFAVPPSPWPEYFTRRRQLQALLRCRKADLEKATLRLGRYGINLTGRRGGGGLFERRA